MNVSENQKMKTNYRLSLGYLDNLNHELPEITSLTDRFEHAYIIGKTGMGKSAFMEHMAEYDMKKDFAVIYIDPKGDSVKKLYQYAKDKAKIKYISIESPVVINPLNKEGYKLDNLIQEFIQILDILVTLTSSNPESTVLMREIISRTMKSITKESEKNLEYLTKFLLYKDVRTALKHELPVDSDLRKYWEEFDSKGNRGVQRVECAHRVASRLIEISTGEMKDFIIGKNELDISGIVEQGETILVDTSRMNRNSRIYLTNLIVYSVLSYCEFAPKKEKPLLVYVDEFQIVVSDLFSDLLARSRGAKVGFTLAHQNFQQIPRDILGAIFGNVGTSVCFRCGDEEAKRFASILDIKATELFNLPKYYAWVRIGTNNTLIETYPPKLKEPPDIDIPNLLNFKKPAEEVPTVPETKDFFFLKDRWISL